MIYLTSDSHYSHHNIILYTKRPFANIDEMNRSLIERHNAVVGKDDDVWHLGDFSLSERLVPIILPQLNGRHRLVCGNHDKCHISFGHKSEAAKERYIKYGFIEVHQEVRVGPFLLNHFPYTGDSTNKDRYTEYRPKDDGSFLLHGHVHSRYGKITSARSIDVGVDAWDYAPVSIETLLAEKDRIALINKVGAC
jgi:calcineurin-like phosphoesterase family protein